MSSRAEKKAAAQARRLEWRTRWSAMARAQLNQGKSIEQAVRTVGLDMDKMGEDSPQLKSEIIRAGNEFLTKLAAAVAVAASKV